MYATEAGMSALLLGMTVSSFFYLKERTLRRAVEKEVERLRKKDGDYRLTIERLVASLKAESAEKVRALMSLTIAVAQAECARQRELSLRKQLDTCWDTAYEKGSSVVRGSLNVEQSEFLVPRWWGFRRDIFEVLEISLDGERKMKLQRLDRTEFCLPISLSTTLGVF